MFLHLKLISSSWKVIQSFNTPPRPNPPPEFLLHSYNRSFVYLCISIPSQPVNITYVLTFQAFFESLKDCSGIQHPPSRNSSYILTIEALFNYVVLSHFRNFLHVITSELWCESFVQTCKLVHVRRSYYSSYILISDIWSFV